MISAMDAARYLESRGPLPEMKLQKLLYYAQAWSLAWTGRPLFADEIEAWVDGPVVRAVWVARHHGHLDVAADAEPTATEKAIIDAVAAHYGTMTGPTLSRLTHAEQPWLEARGELSSTERSRRPISQHTMRRTYTEQSIGAAQPLPHAPVLASSADTEVVTEAVARQRKRWRRALDLLADQ